ncbi:uncharacterized protein PSFLO_01286 [Pseudozyma flocculosa]|uniref:Uncharacterized protein n=1 Tax=Pseudozyma flocculosa TaxID=84751 RepID=A0A5C3EVN5_9BASI|nr:uncharacterized protein PSFLO_01286 [Pseudozyma flocculosa]
MIGICSDPKPPFAPRERCAGLRRPGLPFEPQGQAFAGSLRMGHQTRRGQLAEARGQSRGGPSLRGAGGARRKFHAGRPGQGVQRGRAQAAADAAPARRSSSARPPPRQARPNQQGQATHARTHARAGRARGARPGLARRSEEASRLAPRPLPRSRRAGRQAGRQAAGEPSSCLGSPAFACEASQPACLPCACNTPPTSVCPASPYRTHTRAPDLSSVWLRIASLAPLPSRHPSCLPHLPLLVAPSLLPVTFGCLSSPSLPLSLRLAPLALIAITSSTLCTAAISTSTSSCGYHLGSRAANSLEDPRPTVRATFRSI